MKKIILITFLFILSFIVLFSHDQQDKPVHQKIIVEAYKLLKLQFSKEANGFADMDQYIGNTDIQNIKYWYDVTTVALDVAEHFTYDDILIYPNPSADAMTVVTNSHGTGQAVIYDWTMRLIRKMQFNDINKFTIDISGFSSGIYFLELTDYQGNKTIKSFIKN
jgi:hypothetical protein